MLHFEQETSEAFLEAVHKLENLSDEEKRELAEAAGQDFDDAEIVELSPTQRLRAMNPMFTTFWLLDLIDRIDTPQIPDLHNADGDELVLCEVRYPLAAGTTADDIRAALAACPELRPSGPTSWNWITREKARCGIAR